MSSCALHMPTHTQQNPSREAGRLRGSRLRACELQSRSALCFLAKLPTNPPPRLLTPSSLAVQSLLNYKARLKREPARHNGVFLRDGPIRAGEEGAGLGKEKRKECVRMNEPRGRCGKPGCFYLRRVVLFCSEGAAHSERPRPCSRSGDRSSHRQEEKFCRARVQPGSVSRTADVQRPASRAAISMFINTGLANKLQPCMWRLRSDDRCATQGGPGPAAVAASSRQSGGNPTPSVTSSAQQLSSDLQANRRCKSCSSSCGNRGGRPWCPPRSRT